MQLNPYLMYDGRCEEAFKFYAKALGGNIVAMLKYSDMPEEARNSPECSGPDVQNKIMHALLTIGDEVLMGSDTPAGRYEGAKGFSVSLNVPEPAAAERAFHALAEGGTTIMPIGETFWAQRFGMLTDRFGIPWMINCEKPR